MMARGTESSSDEDIWEYSTQKQKKSKSSATQRVSGGKQKKTPIIAQTQPNSLKGKGKGKGKSSTRPVSSTPQGKSTSTQDRKRGFNKTKDDQKKKDTKSSSSRPANAKATQSQSQIGKKRGATQSTSKSTTDDSAMGPPLKSPRLDIASTPKSTMGHSQRHSSSKKTPNTATKNTKSKTPRASNEPSTPEIQTVNTPVPITSVPKKEGHCPFCQMPFRCLVIESPRWHTTECMDLPLKTTTECPAGIKCDSTLASHYRRFTHSLLANIRAGVSTHKPSPSTSKAMALTPSQKAHIRKLDFDKTLSATKPSAAAGAPTTSPYFKKETTTGLPTIPPSHSKKQLMFTTKEEEEEEDYCQCDSPGCVDSAICSGLASLKASPPSQHQAADEEDEDVETDEDIFNPTQKAKVQETDHSTTTQQTPKYPQSAKKHEPPASSAVEEDEMTFEAKDLSEMLSDALDEGGDISKENMDLAEIYGVQEAEEDDTLPDIIEPVVAPPDEVGIHSDGEEDDLVFTAVHTSIQEPIVIEPEDETVNTDICVVADIPGASTDTPNKPSISANPKTPLTKGGTIQTSIAKFFSFFKNPKQEKQTTNGIPATVQSSSLSVPPPSNKKWNLPRAGSSKTEAVVPKATSGRFNGAAGGGGGGGWGGRKPKQCPFYKKMPGTALTVDAFCYGTIPGCRAYVLTHFHYDHYGGLTRKFNHPIYCSKITGNLVQSKLKVDARYIHTLPLDTPRVVEGVELTFMEANHCPGSVIILFKLPSGQVYLHTGDFRACPEMELYPFLQSVHVHQLYLDTTYCDASYAFPPQKDVIKFAVAKVTEVLRECPNTLVAVGSYTVGKERIFMAIAEDLNCRICVSREKKAVLDCIEDPGLKKRLTLEPRDARVHVLPMRQLKYENLSKYVNGLKPRFDRVLAFEPTGWTHAGGTRHTELDKLRPKYHRDNVTIYGVPYSEHSSYTEMKRFCQVIRPDRILATVNNGSAESRAKMDKLFDSWMKEKLESPSKLKQTGLKTWFR